MIRIVVDDRAYRNFLRNMLPIFNQVFTQQLLSFGEWAVRRVKQEIRSGGSPPFTSLGIAQTLIKQSDRVLIHTGNLSGGIRFRYMKMGRPGFLGGIEVYSSVPPKIATTLQHGTEFTPSAKQRAIVQLKIRRAGSPYDTGFPLGSKIWNIPPRPFMQQALENHETIMKFAYVSARSIDITIARASRRGR